MSRPHIVIVGGGFAGVACAKTLRRRLRDTADITLFNRENHFTFNPLLADAVGSTLNPLDVVVPLRELLPRVRCRSEEVLAIALDTREVEYESYDGQRRRMPYDHLVLACGRTTDLTAVPGMADHAFALKTIGDAVQLRAHVLQQLERADVCDDDARKRWLLSFVIVGGGYSGVEVAGEINDLVRGSTKLFSTIEPADVTVTLVHSQRQLLPEIASTLRDFACDKMRRAGVTVLLESRVELATAEGVRLTNGEFVAGGTVVCTIGTANAPTIDRLEVPKERDRVATDADMRLAGRHCEWAIGDCAWIVNARDGQGSPPTAQFGERQGQQAARNIVRALREEATRPFRFAPLGQLCSIGGHRAVAELFGLKLSGIVAWLIWRATYLAKMPSWARRFQVGFDWAWALVFPRDLSHLKPAVTDRVSRAHYQPGDVIFREGDPAQHLYVLEHGEVEVVRESDREQVIAVLGPGTFFGEQALIDERPRAATVRARSRVEALVLGRHLFARLSHALTPLRNALARSIAPNDRTLRASRPELVAVLSALSVADVVEPIDGAMLSPAATLRDAVTAFTRARSEVIVVADQERLIASLTLADLMRIYADGTAPETLLDGIVGRNPVYLRSIDDGLVAAELLLTHRLAAVPVVDPESGRVVGTVTVRTLLGRALSRAH